MSNNPAQIRATTTNWVFAAQHKGPEDYFTFPYLIVQMLNTGRISAAHFKDLSNINPSKDAGPQMEKLFPNLFQGIKGSAITYDPITRRFWIDISIKKAGQECHGLGTLIPTENGWIEIFLYSTEKEFNFWSPVFHKVGTEVELAPSLAYQPRWSDDSTVTSIVEAGQGIDWSKVISYAITGVIVASIAEVFRRKRKQRAPQPTDQNIRLKPPPALPPGSAFGWPQEPKAAKKDQYKKLKAFGILVALLGASIASGILTNNFLVLALTFLAPLAWFVTHVGRRTRWFLMYATMWMTASVVMTRTYNWPKDSQMTRYEKTAPGQIAFIIGSSLPSAATGIVLGTVGPFAFAIQQMALAYERSHDDEAVKMPGIVAFALGLAVIAIAWFTWPRKSAPDAPKIGLSAGDEPRQADRPYPDSAK